MAGAMKRIIVPMFLAGLGGMSPAVADDGALPDPTRPPEAILAVSPDGGGAAIAGPVLQSVVLRRGGVPVAVISGQMIPLGGKVGDSVLTRIGENEVVLRGPQGSEVLRMTPDVTKTVVTGRPKSAGRRK